jgi:hypothetical protein
MIGPMYRLITRMIGRMMSNMISPAVLFLRTFQAYFSLEQRNSEQGKGQEGETS